MIVNGVVFQNLFPFSFPLFISSKANIIYAFLCELTNFIFEIKTNSLILLFFLKQVKIMFMQYFPK